ncbi:formyltransferase family protein [Spirochaeta africana]|uniref:Phosphoribosylglycinamide formyltransferase n=1 Tax=Spirochaeta africana (strain ATCC 700263 / DSM 8902 / Z-7692) TaxID=889378 RepID=H9UKG3_SPIAZ|nr:formyltransferase family protein [Spirochaeta africana]AFG38006.1 folate-dependent phosphoribosylglycinamide formyltransferase PurN [Spirochaeta africana DSM 8902]
MARCAVFASGNGSNFLHIQESLHRDPVHQLACLVCDRPDAPVVQRALRGGTPVLPLVYQRDAAGKLDRRTAERGVIPLLQRLQVDCLVFAGFMRLITPTLLNAFPDRILNIHPSLLPRHPGARGLADSIASDDQQLGITIHLVDEGMDTGPVICQQSFTRVSGAAPEQEEQQIHELEHTTYPRVIREFLDTLSG